jgi:hypothetical protein
VSGDHTRRGGPRGSLNLSGLLWLAALGAGVYFALMYAPPYVESYEVKQMLRDVAATAVHEPSDEKLKRQILERARNIGSHYEIRDGQELRLPGVVLLDDDVVVNRDTSAKTIIIQVRYTKHVNYPFTQAQTEMTFSPAVKGDIAEIKW